MGKMSYNVLHPSMQFAMHPYVFISLNRIKVGKAPVVADLILVRFYETFHCMFRAFHINSLFFMRPVHVIQRCDSLFKLGIYYSHVMYAFSKYGLITCFLSI